eukprot:CAMPEP_0203767548 /NCGR_PEP_ID=MMETSP0099_2-20121227/1062_1 /ASSEMBLY_ACC=CAM_ASM_000209 /TAXON_ID=96639 /ORGANISM=" , Strain NY0313808BC1" /LENGTH=88 /DNA_ID=CAMNT_0050664077 /DNA_START=1576 /DNA_END=1839 /DNA_ORIENTATION=-
MDDVFAQIKARKAAMEAKKEEKCIDTVKAAKDIPTKNSGNVNAGTSARLKRLSSLRKRSQTREKSELMMILLPNKIHGVDLSKTCPHH